MSSKYTSLTNCRMLYNAAIDPAAELKDGFESIYPGRDGLTVILEGFDARSWISLLPRGTNNKVELHSNWMGFPGVAGKLLEWRYHGSELIALIVRIERSTDPTTAQTVSTLEVWRVNIHELNQACLIGETPSNETAHAIADDPNRPGISMNIIPDQAATPSDTQAASEQGDEYNSSAGHTGFSVFAPGLSS